MTFVALLRSMVQTVATSVTGGRLRKGETAGRQDKRGSPVVIQVLERTCLSACLLVGARAALKDFHNEFNAVSGTVLLRTSTVRR